MKTQLKNGLIASMIFMSASAFSQTTEVTETTLGTQRVATTYFRVLLNLVNTNLDYGQSSQDLWGHRTSNRGLQAGVSFQAGITPRVSLVSEFYYLRKTH